MQDRDEDGHEPSKYLYEKQYRCICSSHEQQREVFLKVESGLSCMKIDERFFEVTLDLIDHFKFPVLFLLATPYRKIQNDIGLSSQFEQQMRNVAKVAVKHSLDHRISELGFLYQKGINAKFSWKSNTKIRVEFVNYIVSLSRQKHRLQNLLANKETPSVEGLQLEENTQPPSVQMRYFERSVENLYKSDILRLKREILERNSNRKQNECEKVQNQQQGTNLSQEVGPRRISVSPSAQQLESLRKVPSCCRRFFYRNEVIEQPEGIHMYYMNGAWPFSSEAYTKITKAVCGFANSEGGVIILGINTNPVSMENTATGFLMTEGEAKEVEGKVLQRLHMAVKPAIETKALRIYRVPLKNYRTNKFSSGCFLFKLMVQKKSSETIHSFYPNEQSSDSFLPLMTEAGLQEVKDCSVMFKIFEESVKQPKKSIVSTQHEWVCPVPDAGDPVYDPKHLFDSDGSEKDKQPMTSIQKQKQTICSTQNAYLLEGINMEQARALLPKYYKQSFNKMAQVDHSSLYVETSNTQALREIQLSLSRNFQNPLEISVVPIELEIRVLTQEAFMTTLKFCEEMKCSYSLKPEGSSVFELISVSNPEKSLQLWMRLRKNGFNGYFFKRE